MPRTKKWYLKEDRADNGTILLLRDGQELQGKNGKSIGLITFVKRPSTRKGCDQAKRMNFYDTALQVS